MWYTYSLAHPLEFYPGNGGGDLTCICNSLSSSNCCCFSNRLVLSTSYPPAIFSVQSNPSHRKKWNFSPTWLSRRKSAWLQNARQFVFFLKPLCKPPTPSLLLLEFSIFYPLKHPKVQKRIWKLSFLSAKLELRIRNVLSPHFVQLGGNNCPWGRGEGWIGLYQKKKKGFSSMALFVEISFQLSTKYFSLKKKLMNPSSLAPLHPPTHPQGVWTIFLVLDLDRSSFWNQPQNLALCIHIKRLEAAEFNFCQELARGFGN